MIMTTYSARTFEQIVESGLKSVTSEEGGELRFIAYSSSWDGAVSYEFALPGERWESFWADKEEVAFLDRESAAEVDAALLAKGYDDETVHTSTTH